MKRIQYTVDINAPIELVYDRMLGLTSKASYEQWTAAFNPTSTFEGKWEKGSKMLFVGTDENGAKGGMVSRIVDVIPHQFVSIQHIGMMQDGKEITEGPEIEQWANGFENYTFSATDGKTTVTVDLDTTEDFVEYMDESYPKALLQLKALCEK